MARIPKVFYENTIFISSGSSCSSVWVPRLNIPENPPMKSPDEIGCQRNSFELWFFLSNPNATDSRPKIFSRMAESISNLNPPTNSKSNGKLYLGSGGQSYS